MIARLFLLSLALLSLTVPAFAEPCGAVLRRSEAAATLRLAAEEHPIHVRFSTRAPGVTLSADLIDKYPHDMTIVLQHEFHKLAVGDDGFSVSLWFNRHYQRLVVPFDAVTGFWDNGTSICSGG